MGRAFEYRKATKLKRWGNMARVFTRLGKQITVAAKDGGPDPATNPKLRALIQTAKSENMPKENVERAIKKATAKDVADFKEMVYEGYGPYGVAVLIETATDNPTRTVANVRSYFNKYNGSLGTSGSLSFMFDHKSVFKVKKKDNVDLEELELELIDFGVDEIFAEDDAIVAYAEFSSFGALQKYFEENSYELLSAEFVRIPTDTKELTPEQQVDIQKLLDKLDEDEDVTNVFHNMKEND